MQIKLGNTKVGDGRPTYLVAEIGQNHNGDSRLANNLIKIAAEAGCNAFKLTRRDLDHEMTPDLAQRPYLGPQSYGATYMEHRQALEIDRFDLIVQRAQAFNDWDIDFIVTPCSPTVIPELEECNPVAYKVASRDIDNMPLIRAIWDTGRPVIISTGMASLDDISRVRSELMRLSSLADWRSRVVLLLCTSRYPCPNNDVHLSVMPALRDRFDCLVGLSDHTTGLPISVAAAGMGACLIEKHITFNRAASGSDHAASLEPDGVHKWVQYVHAVGDAIGSVDGWQARHEDTERNALRLRRSLCAAQELIPGYVLHAEDVCMLSPGTGLRWSQLGDVVGKTVVNPISKHQQLRLSDFAE